MKYLKLKFLLMFFALAMAIPPAWAETVTTTYTFSSKSWEATPENWSGSSDGLQFNTTSNPAGVQVTASLSGVTVTSPKSYNNISKIVITYTSTKNAVGTINVYVGNNQVGSQSVSKSQTRAQLTYTVSNMSGIVKFQNYCYTNSYGINSIAITYEEGGGEQPQLEDVTLSFPEDTYTATLGQTFTAPTLSVTPAAAASEVVYSSSNTGVATVDASTGAVTLVSSGTTTITAEISNSETYKNASAFYNLTVAPDMSNAAILDFTEVDYWTPNLPDSNHKITDEQSFNDGTYTVKITGTTGSYWTSNYMLVGKEGAYIQLPAFNRAVTSIDVEGTNSASGSVTQNIFVGGEAVSTETLGKGNHSYDIASDYQAAGNIYTLKVTNGYNTQVKKIIIHFDENSSEVPLISVTPSSVTITDVTGDDKTGTISATVNPAGTVNATATDGWSATSSSVTYQGLALHAEGTATFSSTGATDVEASLEYNYTGPLYILGTVNNGGWAPNNYVEMTRGTDGLYTVRVTTNAGENGMSWISFTKRIANDNDNGAWGYIAPYRFVPYSENVNTAWWLTDGTVNQFNALDFNTDHVDGQPVRMSPGTYDITINPNDNTFKIEPYIVTVETPTFDPEAGSYKTFQSVTISCATEGATIHYTTDGSEPTESSPVYGDPIAVESTTTIKAIAIKSGMANSAIAEATYNLPQTVANVAAAMDVAANSYFLFTGEAVVTYAGQSTINSNYHYIFIRDKGAKNGGGVIYYNTNNNNVTVPSVQATNVLKRGWYAQLRPYNSWKEFQKAEFVEASGETAAAAPFDRTGMELKYDDNVNEYVKIDDVTYNDGNITYAGQNREDVTYTYKVVNHFNVVLEEGKHYNIEGVVTRNNNTIEFYPTAATLAKQDPKLAFAEETVNATFGADFTEPELTKPEGVTVKYSSENTEVAEVNETTGEVTIKKIGNAKIIATSVENQYYTAGTASYNIVVTAGTPTFAYSAATASAVFGQTATLPTLSNPNNLTVTYTSSKPEVATVNENGEVTIVGIGETVIKATGAATGNYAGAEAQYTLTVTAATPTFAYSAATASAVFGQTATLPTLSNPNGLTVTYTSSNADVATVNAQGEVTIVGIGETIIKAVGAATGNYAGAESQYTLTVTAATPTFAYSAATASAVFGQTATLPTLSNPNNLTVTYTSSKPAVATVNTQGEVTIVGAGTTTITATGAATGNYGAATASYELTVAQGAAGLSYPEGTSVTATVGDNNVVKPTLNNPNELPVTWSSDNESVATVDAEGNVTIVGPGTAHITATYTAGEDSNYATGSATYTITVNDVVVALAAPTFAPAAGTYTEPKEVAIACATPGVTIEYTIDGVTKTYEGPFLVNRNCTVTATAMMGTRTVYTPATSSATYTINAADAATIADDYYFLQSNAAEVSGKYANVAGRRTLNFVADADKQAGTVFRVMTDPDTIGQVETLRSQAVDLQGYANRAMAYVPKVIDLVLSTLANSSLGDPETPGTGILGENGLDLILNKFYEGFDYNLYVEQADGGYRIFGRTPSMQHVVDFYHENTAQVEEKLPMLEGYINQVLDKIRNKIPAPYDANVVVPFSLKTVRDRIADKYGIALIDPTQDLMGFYRQVLNNKEYVWDFAYQTAMMYVDVIKETQTYKNLPDEYKLYVTKMEKVRPDTKYYIIERGNELDYISENNGDIIKNDPRTLWTLTKRVNFTVNVPETNKLNDSYYTTLYTDFGYELPTGVKAYAVTGIDENDVAQLTEITGAIPAQTPVLLKADADGDKVLTLKKENRGGAIEDNLLEGPDYLITKYQIKTPAVVSLFNMAQGFVPADVLAAYEYLQLRYSGTVNNKYFWNVNSDLEDLQGDCVVRSLAVKDNELAFSEHWKTETNKAFLVSDTKPVIYLEKDTLAAPTFSPVPGSYTVDNGQNVTITITAEDGATIYYKIGDGEYQRYNGPITASDDMTIVAKAEKDGMIASNEVTAVYVIDNPAELPDVPVMKGYFQIKNNGNERYAHVQGRKTLTFTDAPADKAGTVIWLETDGKGKVISLRSQAADLQRYAYRALDYVPDIVQIVVDKLGAEGEGHILGQEGLDAIMDKFDKSFKPDLYIEKAGENGYRIYGKTPSMQPVVDFYRENKDKVEAKLPDLVAFINSALAKLRAKAEQAGMNGDNVFVDFDLKTIWERMGGNLTDPEVDEMGFYRDVLNYKDNVWNFAYQTAMIYLNNIKGTQTYQNLVNEHPEISQYIDKIDQIRPDFKYYIVQKDDKPDFISEGNVDIINDAARTIWTVEPRTTFTVNITGEQFGCPLATNGVGGYFTTNYTDFAYTLPEGVTAYKVTGVNDEGEATLEALSGTIPAQTPVLLVAKEEGDYALILSTEADTPVENNLLVGPDYLGTKHLRPHQG